MNAQHEGGGDECPGQIAGNHHSPAVCAVEQNTRNRPGRQHRHGPRQKNSGDDQSRIPMLHRQAHHRDVIEVIANLADNLSEPKESVIPVRAQQVSERAQCTSSVRTVTLRMKSESISYPNPGSSRTAIVPDGVISTAGTMMSRFQ